MPDPNRAIPSAVSAPSSEAMGWDETCATPREAGSMPMSSSAAAVASNRRSWSQVWISGPTRSASPIRVSRSAVSRWSVSDSRAGVGSVIAASRSGGRSPLAAVAVLVGWDAPGSAVWSVPDVVGVPDGSVVGVAVPQALVATTSIARTRMTGRGLSDYGDIVSRSGATGIVHLRHEPSGRQRRRSGRGVASVLPGQADVHQMHITG